MSDSNAFSIVQSAPVPSTTQVTRCYPNGAEMNLLEQRAGLWKVYQNRVNFVAILKYEGSSEWAGTWAQIFDRNNSMYSELKTAINSCKKVTYMFDDYALVSSRARSRLLKMSDSNAFSIVM